MEGIFHFEEATMDDFEVFWSPPPLSLSPDVPMPNTQSAPANLTFPALGQQQMPQLQPQFSHPWPEVIATAPASLEGSSVFTFPPPPPKYRPPTTIGSSYFPVCYNSSRQFPGIPGLPVSDSFLDFLDDDVFYSNIGSSTAAHSYQSTATPRPILSPELQLPYNLSYSSSGFESDPAQSWSASSVSATSLRTSPSNSSLEHSSPVSSVSTQSVQFSWPAITSTSPQPSLPTETEESQLLDSILDILDEYEGKKEINLATTEPHKDDKHEIRDKVPRFCVVCSKSAKGFNFGVISCECCKAFFRRNARLPEQKRPVCQYGRSCQVMPLGRKNSQYCSACRLDRCFQMGMRSDLILSDEERRLRREKSEQNRIKRAEKQKSRLQVANSPILTTNADKIEKDVFSFPPLSEEVKLEPVVKMDPFPQPDTVAKGWLPSVSLPPLKTEFPNFSSSQCFFVTTAQDNFRQELSLLQHQLGSSLLLGLANDHVESLFMETNLSHLVLFTVLSMTSDCVGSNQESVSALYWQLQGHPGTTELLQTAGQELQELHRSLDCARTTNVAQLVSFLIVYDKLHHHSNQATGEELWNRWSRLLQGCIAHQSGISLSTAVLIVSSLCRKLVDISSNLW